MKALIYFLIFNERAIISKVPGSLGKRLVQHQSLSTSVSFPPPVFPASLTPHPQHHSSHLKQALPQETIQEPEVERL